MDQTIDINEVFTQALTFHQNKEFQKAIQFYNIVLSINPNHGQSNHNIGLISMQFGNLQVAINFLERAYNIDPNNENFKKNLEKAKILLNKNEISLQVIDNQIITLYQQNRFDEAIELAKNILEKEPKYLFGLKAIGTIYIKQRNLLEALSYLEKAKELNDKDAEIYNNLGSIYKDLCEFEKSEESYKKALELNPNDRVAYDNFLFAMNYHPTKSAQEIFNLYEEFEQKFCKPLYKYQKKHTNSKNINRKLKVGYVSADFIDHPVKNFLEPLISNHDKSKFEIYLYSHKRKEDEFTKRYKNYADNFIEVQDIDDKNLAKRIKDDEIDILVDLSGHTADNRLLTFALKPAPVSYSWLGYGYTTGVSAIDYYLSDEYNAPEGCEDLFSETPYRIDNPFYIYRAPKNTGEVSKLPYLKNNYITFGTLSRSVRLNSKIIAIWSEVLKKVPNSKLIIDSKDFLYTNTQEEFIRRFEDLGIKKERLEFGYNSPPWDTLRKIDIGLDCFPQNSGTTLFETLYMGIPYVTLEDRPSVGRLGSSILHGLKRTEWITKNKHEYIKKLVDLAKNTKSLEKIRNNLREEMKNSALMDEKGFTKKVEKAYIDMFNNWAEK